MLQDLRALRRSRDDRVVAGVCGGVARQLGIDPLLVRVVTAVLFFFGAGVVLYALGWLLLPLDDGTPSVGEQAVARGGAQSSTSTVLLAVGLAVAASLGLGAAFRHWDGPFLFFSAAGALVAWLILRDRRGEPPVAATPPPAYASAANAGATQPGAANPGATRPGTATTGTTYAAAAPPAAGMSLGTAPRASGQPTGPAATNPLPTYRPQPTYQPPYPPSHQPPYQTGQQPYGYQPPAGPPRAPYGAVPPPVTPPPPPAPRRPRSALFSVTMSLVLVGLGTLKLVELSGTSVAAGAYPALALAIIAVALVVGTWFGRSRGLIAMGIIAALLTGAVSAADSWDNHGRNHVNLRLTPATVAELPSSQDFGAGSVRYDLTRIDFTGTNHTMKLSVGAGEIVVVVPRDVDVTATASLGIGQVDLFGQGRGGFPSDVTVTNVGDDGVGGGTLALNLDAGIGHLEVRRG